MLQFKVYRNKPNQPESIASNTINSLMIDKDGSLWIGTMDGLSLYDKEQDIFYNYFFEKNGVRLQVYEVVDWDKEILVGTHQGLLAFNKRQKTFRVIEYLPRINSLYVTEDSILIGTASGLYTYSIRHGNLYKTSFQLSGTGISTILQHEQYKSKYWIGTEGKGFPPR